MLGTRTEDKANCHLTALADHETFCFFSIGPLIIETIKKYISREKIQDVAAMCMVVLIVQLEKKVRLTKTMHNEYKMSKDLECYKRKIKVKRI